MSAIEESLRDRVAQILQVAPGNVDASKPLSFLGLDSLAMLQLTESIEADLGAEWQNDSWPGQYSIESLANLLRESAVSKNRPTADPLNLMLADSVLPSDIRPSGIPPSDPATILLTG